MFWADQIVEEIIQKRQAPYKVFDTWTPSGLAHAGHIRTFLLHQAVYQGLKMAGKDVTYFYGFDDIDPMDGFPPGLPEEWRQYMGQPLSKIPSPVEGFKSLGAYYAAKYLEAMEVLDIHPQVPTTTEMYENGEFNAAITIILDNAQKVRDIYADLGAERPADWHAFQPICENCGKIGTTYVTDWDGQTVAYRCEPKLVTWAEGCGHVGRVSPYNGNGKMPWKPEWAAKWFLIGTDYEGGGKDHFTKNGSRDYARRIVADVFEAQEPIGYAHEFFLLGGAKMSSSKGKGMTANEAASLLPPHIMRFFVYRVAPNRQIEFSPDGDTIAKIYDEFDRGLTALTDIPDANEARAIVYAYQDEKEYPLYTLRFSKVAFLIQLPHIDVKEFAETEKGEALTPAEAQELDSRVEYARRWLDTYAPEEAKVVLHAEMPSVELSESQITYLTHVKEKLNEVEWNGEAIHAVLHELKNSLGLAPKEAFGALYLIFLGKISGPQAGWFLAALDKSFVLSRLNEATQGATYA